MQKNTKNAIPFANCVFLIIENYIYKYLLLDTTSISKNHLDSQIILEEELNKSCAYKFFFLPIYRSFEQTHKKFLDMKNYPILFT